MTRPGARGALALFLIAMAGLIAVWIEARQRRTDEVRFPRIGTAVDVDGISLNALAIGEGSPAVVFDAGMGGSLHTWAWVQPEVGRVTRAVSFDRPGMGYSDPAPTRRTADHVARELRGVLGGLGVSPPYVLVGHSLGGFTVRAYAALYPEEVAGIVFVDSTHEDADARYAEIGEEEGHLMDLIGVARFGAPLGATRLLSAVHLIPPLEVLEPLPPGMPDRVLAEFRRGAALDTYWRENHDYPASAQWIAGTGDLGDLPLVALTRDLGGGADPGDAIAAELQEELAALSTRGVVREIPQSRHSSTVLAERHARVVSDAIIAMVEELRGGASVREARVAP